MRLSPIRRTCRVSIKLPVWYPDILKCFIVHRVSVTAPATPQAG